MILASHSTEIIREFCDRAVIIHKGEATEYDDVNRAVDLYSNL